MNRYCTLTIIAGSIFILFITGCTSKIKKMVVDKEFDNLDFALVPLDMAMEAYRPEEIGDTFFYAGIRHHTVLRYRYDSTYYDTLKITRRHDSVFAAIFKEIWEEPIEVLFPGDRFLSSMPETTWDTFILNKTNIYDDNHIENDYKYRFIVVLRNKDSLYIQTDSKYIKLQEHKVLTFRGRRIKRA